MRWVYVRIVHEKPCRGEHYAQNVYIKKVFMQKNIDKKISSLSWKRGEKKSKPVKIRAFVLIAETKGIIQTG